MKDLIFIAAYRTGLFLLIHNIAFSQCDIYKQLSTLV